MKLVDQPLVFKPWQHFVGKDRPDLNVGRNIGRNPANFLHFTIGRNFVDIFNHEYVHPKLFTRVMATSSFSIINTKFFEVTFGYI